MISSPSRPRLQVSIITGPLGSGKTTLLQRIVQTNDFQSGNTALLINDAGPVNVDAVIFRGKAKEVRAITGGCICCTNPEEFKSALLEFSSQEQIQKVWIEASGIASIDDILDQLLEGSLPQKIQIQEIILMMDAPHYNGHFFHLSGQKSQIALANRVILNKIDLVEASSIPQMVEEIQSWNPHAVVHTSIRSEIDWNLKQSSPLPRSTLRKKSLRAAHATWNTHWIPISHPQKMKAVTQFIQNLPEEVYRVKGFVQISDQMNRLHFFQKVTSTSEVICWEYCSSIDEKGLVLLARGNVLNDLQHPFQ